MRSVLITLPLTGAKDTAHARQQLRALCASAEVSAQAGTRFATGISELARQAARHGGGTMELAVEIEQEITRLIIVVRDKNSSKLKPDSSREESVQAARKLIAQLHIEALSGGGIEAIASLKLERSTAPNATDLEIWRANLQHRFGVTADELVTQQNRELAQTMIALQLRESELRKRVEEIRNLNQALEETNRGLVLIHQQLADRNSELDQARKIAETATQTKANFLANMSHEIRTPMNAVVGLADLLSKTPLQVEQEDYVSTIQSSAAHLLGILNDVLDFSKIESNKLELEQRPFVLRHCVESAMDMIAVTAEQNQINVAYLFEADVPEVLEGDETRILQILINYLSNAVKFSQGGDIVVHFGSTKLDDEHHEIVVSVTDTGIGIDPDRIERLFKTFSQADVSTTRQFGGTGLGLAICKRLAELMGGGVGVQSQPDIGSRFWFSFKAKENRQTRAQDSQASACLKDRCVLILDSNQPCQQMLQEMIKSWGMRPFSCAGPEQALALLKSGQRIDAALISARAGEVPASEMACAILTAAGRELPMIQLGAHGSLQSSSSHFASSLPRPVRSGSLRAVLDCTFGADATGERSHPADDRRSTQGRDSEVPHLGLKVLLAEDNTVNQMVASKMLALLGCEVDVAKNGREAVERAQRHPYHVILMDMHMPLMDGIEATLEICKRLPESRRPTIIAMTASALTGERESCLAAGMNDYLGKPVRLEQLSQALRRSTSASADSDSTAPHPEEELTFSADALRTLESSIGKQGLIETITALIQDEPRLTDGMALSISRRDAKGIKLYAHTMRSCADMVGADDISKECADLESLATRQGDEDKMCKVAAAVSLRYQNQMRDIAKQHAGPDTAT